MGQDIRETPVRTRGPGDQTGLHSCSIHDKTVQGSPWGDALQRMDMEAPIESFQRSNFVEIWICLWSNCRL